MKKQYRIKKNQDFSLVFRKGKSVANRQFVLYVLHKPEQEHFRIGLSVSKKIGNAVMRNQIKRRIREVCQQLKDELDHEKDYVIIARKPTARMNFSEIKSSLIHLFRLAKVLRKTRVGDSSAD